MFSIYNFVISMLILVSEEQENRKMKNVCILLLITINTAYCYYFYNPSTHDLIVLKSLNNVPKGYRLVPPPRDRKRSSLTKDKTGGYCNDPGFKCDAPYNKSSTFQFECTTDDQCPTRYKCCPHKCFLHKICVKASTAQRNQESKRKYSERQGECETWPYHCSRPYKSSFTQDFRCNSDGQCPRNFKCCQQNCFVHRICSRVKSQAKKPPIRIVEGNRAPIEEKPLKHKTEPQQVTSPTTTVTLEDDYADETKETTPETTSTTQHIRDENEGTISELETAGTDTTPETTSTTQELHDEDDGVILEATAADLKTTGQYDLETNPETTTILEETTEIHEPLEDDESDPTENDTHITENKPAEEDTTEAQTEVNLETETETTTGHIPKRTTLDSNAINPEYADYYYEYDNVTDINDEQYEYDDEDTYVDAQ